MSVAYIAYNTFAYSPLFSRQPFAFLSVKSRWIKWLRVSDQFCSRGKNQPGDCLLMAYSRNRSSVNQVNPIRVLRNEPNSAETKVFPLFCDFWTRDLNLDPILTHTNQVQSDSFQNDNYFYDKLIFTDKGLLFIYLYLQNHS